MRSAQVSVGTTATLVVDADNQNRTVLLHALSNTGVYYGASNVTTSTGFLHEKDDGPLEVFVPIGETLYGIVASGTETVSVLMPNA